MNNNDFLEYVQNEKENLYFDRKSARIEPKDIIRHVVAFANANGGKLVIGVENDGRLTGFTNIQVHSVEEYKLKLCVHAALCLNLNVKQLNMAIVMMSLFW